jgi:hypothetical protein
LIELILNSFLSSSSCSRTVSRTLTSGKSMPYMARSDLSLGTLLGTTRPPGVVVALPVVVAPGARARGADASVAAPEYVAAYHVIPIGVERLARTQQIAPPSLEARVAREGVAYYQHVVARCVQRAVGVVGHVRGVEHPRKNAWVGRHGERRRGVSEGPVGFEAVG